MYIMAGVCAGSDKANRDQGVITELSGGVAVNECGDDLPHKDSDRRECAHAGQDAQDGVHFNDEGNLLDLRGAGDAGVEFVSIHTEPFSLCPRLLGYAADLLKDRTNVPIAAM